MAAAAAQQQPPAADDKQLHSDLRGLLQRAKDTQHELAASGGANIRALLDEANAAHGRVTKPRECAVDVQVFGIITESGLNHVNRLAHNGKGYSAADLVARLKTRYVDHVDAQEVGAADPAAFDWGALGRGLAGWFRTAPHCHHMLGPMDAAPKAKRVMAQRRKKDAIAEAVQPRSLEEAGDEEKQETDRNMEEMWRVLRAQGGAAPLLELVLDHASFAQTVENLFALSFLVRDGRVELRDGEGGVQVVQRTRGGGGGGGGAREAPAETERVQFVVTVDMAQWEEWKAAVGPEETLMPHRVEWRQRAQAAAAEAAAAGGGDSGGEEQPGPSTKRARR